MSNNNTESNNSDAPKPRRFGDDIPNDPDRQAELVEESIQRYLEMQRCLEQEAEEYLYRSVYYDYSSGIDHGDE